MEVTSPAPHAPSLTRYRIHRFTSGYFYDEYEPLSVVCCCFFSVDRQFQLLCGFAHCRISAVLRWPALRVCHFPAGTQWLATVLNHCTFKNWSHVRCVLSPSLLPLPGVCCQRGSIALVPSPEWCLEGWIKRFDLGPGVSWVLAPG